MTIVSYHGNHTKHHELQNSGLTDKRFMWQGNDCKGNSRGVSLEQLLCFAEQLCVFLENSFCVLLNSFVFSWGTAFVLCQHT